MFVGLARHPRPGVESWALPSRDGAQCWSLQVGLTLAPAIAQSHGSLDVFGLDL